MTQLAKTFLNANTHCFEGWDLTVTDILLAGGCKPFQSFKKATECCVSRTLNMFEALDLAIQILGKFSKDNQIRGQRILLTTLFIIMKN